MIPIPRGILQMLDLLPDSTPEQAIEAIRKIQRTVEILKRRTADLEETREADQARLRRAEDPDNWRAIWTGDPSTNNVETTALSHGNLVELDGVGQVFMVFRPCCQNLRCKCTTRRNQGYCACHENDE